jgi:hypothetical protein
MMGAGAASTTATMPQVNPMGDVTGFPMSITTAEGAPTDKSQQITLYNPKIVDVSQDQLDYANGGSVLTWTITWRYESYAYGPPQTTSLTAVGGVIGDTARGVQEIGRSVGRFFENVIRRF